MNLEVLFQVNVDSGYLVCQAPPSLMPIQLILYRYEDVHNLNIKLGLFLSFFPQVELTFSRLTLLLSKYTEKIKFSNFLKCLYCYCFEKYYNAADHIELV